MPVNQNSPEDGYYILNFNDGFIPPSYIYSENMMKDLLEGADNAYFATYDLKTAEDGAVICEGNSSPTLSLYFCKRWYLVLYVKDGRP